MNKFYFCKIKTAAELAKGFPDHHEYFEELNEVYEMINKYGGKKMWFEHEVEWYASGNKIDRYYAEEVKNDDTLGLDKGDRFFYEYELNFLYNNIISIDDNLFEL